MLKTSNIMLSLKILDVIDKICDSDDDDEDKILDTTIGFINKKYNNTFEASITQQQQIEKSQINIINPTKGLIDNGNPIESLTETEFYKIYKLNKETVLDVLEMIRYGLIKHTNRGKPVMPIIEILITLRFLTTGSFQMQTTEQVSQPTVSRIIKKITTLISELKLRFIKFPDKSESKCIFEKFSTFGGFPEVFGCLDSTHIGIKCPGKALADDYLNDKGYYSLNCQIICGPNYEFYDIISRWPGAMTENKIFNMSEARQKFEYHQLDGILLAGYNYYPCGFVMTPIQTPRNLQEWKYNESHKKTFLVNKMIEQWKKRFKCLQIILNNKEDTVQNIISACAVLHNIAIERNLSLLPEDEAIPVKEINGKENVKRKYGLEMNIHNETLGILDRNAFLQKHF